MFNKSALLIIIGAAFAVALPTGSTPKGPSTLDNVHVLGASISDVSDVETLITKYVDIADVHKKIREIAHPSFQPLQVEKEKAPTVPKDTLSIPVVSLPRDVSLVTDELPEVNPSTASVLKNPVIKSSKILRSIIPSLPSKGKDKEESETPDASTLKPPSGSASISWYARTQHNNTMSEDAHVSRMEFAVGDVVIKGNLPREHHIPGVHMPSVPSTPELTESSLPNDLNSFATNAAKGLESASSRNVKPPSLARRAESCDSDYTLTYCKSVLQSDDSAIPKLLQSIHVDTSITGPVGLSCSDEKTADYIYPLCSKMMGVQDLALDCVEAVRN